MGFLRTVAASSTATAVTAAATALALNSLSPSSSSSYTYNFTKPFLNSFPSTPNRFDLNKTHTKPPSALHMDAKPALMVRTVYLNLYGYSILIFWDCNLSLSSWFQLFNIEYCFFICSTMRNYRKLWYALNHRFLLINWSIVEASSNSSCQFK